MRKIIIVGLIALFLFVSLNSLVNNKNFSMIQNQNSQIRVNLTHQVSHIYKQDCFNVSNAIFINTIGNDSIQLNLPLFGIYNFGNEELNAPIGITVNGSGYIYIADQNNGQVSVFFPNRTFFFSFGSLGLEDWQFNQLNGITTDSNGNVYVTDKGWSRIQKFTAEGTYLWKKGGIFSTLWDIKVNSTLGYVYVSDNTQIQVFGTNSTHLFDFGTGRFGYAGAIAINKSGAIYVSDQLYYRIVVFSSIGNYLFNFTTLGTSVQFHTFNSTGFLFQANHNVNHYSIFDFHGHFVYNSSNFAIGSDLQGIAIYNNFIYIVRMAGEIYTFFQNGTYPQTIGYTIGSYISQIYDLGNYSNYFINFVNISYILPGDSELEASAQFSVNNINWSGWLPLGSLPNQTVNAEMGRYIQIMFNLSASIDYQTPSLDYFLIEFESLIANEIPSVQDILTLKITDLYYFISCVTMDQDDNALNVTLYNATNDSIIKMWNNVGNNSVCACFLNFTSYMEYEFYFEISDSENITSSENFSIITSETIDNGNGDIFFLFDLLFCVSIVILFVISSTVIVIRNGNKKGKVKGKK
jgi:hypothetical protein